MNSDFRRNGRHDPRGAAVKCWTEVISGCSVVHVSGEVDAATAHILEEALNAARAAPYPVIVDFAATRYIDSRAIHVLLRAKQQHRQTVAAAALGPTLRRIFQLTMVDQIIPLYDTLDDALATVCVPAGHQHP